MSWSSILESSMVEGAIYPTTHHVPPEFKGLALGVAQLYFTPQSPQLYTVSTYAISQCAHELLPRLENDNAVGIKPQNWLVLAALVYMYFWSSRGPEERDAVNECLAQGHRAGELPNIAQIAVPDDIIDWIEENYHQSEERLRHTTGVVQQSSTEASIEASNVTTREPSTSVEDSEASTEFEYLGDYIHELREIAAQIPRANDGSSAFEPQILAIPRFGAVTERFRIHLLRANLLAQRPIAPQPNLDFWQPSQ